MNGTGNKQSISAKSVPERQPSTYVRKVGVGLFEFGFVQRSGNFRKRPDVYTAMGVRTNVADAEAGRVKLEGTHELRC